MLLGSPPGSTPGEHSPGSTALGARPGEHTLGSTAPGSTAQPTLQFLRPTQRPGYEQQVGEEMEVFQDQDAGS